jgi:hypothetical protein
MTQICGGKISFTDGVKSPVEYAPPKKAEVEITFSVDAGEDHSAVLDQVMSLVRLKVSELLDQTPSIIKAPSKPPAPKVEPKQEHAKSDKIIAAEAALVEGKRPEDTRVADLSAADADDARDMDANLDLEAAPKEYTDTDLNKACGEAVKRLGGNLPVRKLVGEYAPRISAIPQEKRGAFLKELAALK